MITVKLILVGGHLQQYLTEFKVERTINRIPFIHLLGNSVRRPVVWTWYLKKENHKPNVKSPGDLQPLSCVLLPLARRVVKLTRIDQLDTLNLKSVSRHYNSNRIKIEPISIYNHHLHHKRKLNHCITAKWPILNGLERPVKRTGSVV